MSYDIYLTDPVSGEELEVNQPHFMGGGTQALNGTKTLWLNITYNYSGFYYRDDVFGKDGIRSIYNFRFFGYDLGHSMDGSDIVNGNYGSSCTG